MFNILKLIFEKSFIKVKFRLFKFNHFVLQFFRKIIIKNVKNGSTYPISKISDENDDDEPHVTGLKDEPLQHLVGYDHYIF